MPIFSGISVSVLVDGQPLPEYAVAVDSSSSPAKIEAWIPSETGKKFAFRFRAGDDKQSYGAKGVVFAVEVDGHRCGAFWAGDISTTLNNLNGEASSKRRPWTFANAKIVSEADGDWTKALFEQQKANGISSGRLRVTVWKFKPSSGTIPIPSTQSGWAEPDIAIHEKAKLFAPSKDNALFTHTTKIGDVVSRERSLHDGTYLDQIAVFTFNYRSLDLLDALGKIAPPPPPPEPVQAPPEHRTVMVNGVPTIDLDDDEDEDVVSVPKEQRLDSGIGMSDDAHIEE